MSDEFRLIYYHRETGKEYRVKRLSFHDYIIMDLETGTKMPLSHYFLNKNFKADKRNSKPCKRSKLDFRRKKTRDKQSA